MFQAGAFVFGLGRGTAAAAVLVLAAGLTGCGTGDVVGKSAGATPTTAASSRSWTPSPTPVITVRHLTMREPIPFKRVRRHDPSMDIGTERVTTPDKKGVRTILYEVKYRGGVETSHRVLQKKISVKPVNQVTSIGTRKPPAPQAVPQSGCDPNYSGGCVPIDSDVDCAGGSGNGPSYVQGPVSVVGSDIYDLDADHDGLGCES